ncbi:hypothetical protein ACI65C_009393 [Semiaphis heraclei]
MSQFDGNYASCVQYRPSLATVRELNPDNNSFRIIENDDSMVLQSIGVGVDAVPFHDVERSERWMNMIGINEIKNKNYFVCEKHFKSCDFDHNGIGVNIKKLKSSAVPKIELNDDNSDENLPLNENEMNDSIYNEKSPIKINDITPKILFHQSLNSNQESSCDYCNRRHNILKAREYHLKKLAEIKEEENKLPLSCPCGNMENLKSNKQCMTLLDECNKNVATLTPKALARRASILDHSHISSPSKLIKHKNKNTTNIKIRKVKSTKMIQKCRRQIKTLKSWYHEIKVEEGFTEASFTALKSKSLVYKQNGYHLYCSMIFDEMHIK